MTNVQTFDHRRAASSAASRTLAEALTSRLQRDDRAALVVSGGSTPAVCLELLSDAALPWHRVTVLPTDERCVPSDDAASNERLVREHLMRGAAAHARFMRLRANGAIAAPMPFAGVLLGMGEDGHFASLFADAPGLAAALLPDAEPACLAIRTSASPLPRVSLNLAALLASERLLLLAFGDAKRRIIEDPAGRPVEALLTQTRTPVEVLWAP